MADLMAAAGMKLVRGVVVTLSTPIEDQIRERLSRIIGALQPIATSTGTFSDVRRADHTLVSRARAQDIAMPVLLEESTQ
jgi:hypothetical protein